MKIGIDAKWLFDGPPSGRRVVGNLLRAMAERAEGDELHAFVDARSRSRQPPAIAGIQWHYLWAGNNQLSNLFALPRLADALGMDVVIYQNFAARLAGVRHARVAFVHDIIFESRPDLFTRRERLYFKSLRYLTARADRVATVSNAERARLIRFGYATADSIDVVPNAVDAQFVPRDKLPHELVDRVRQALVLPERFVLYAGRVSARKNVATLVRAMALTADRDIILVVAGAADSTVRDLDSIATEAGVSHRVRLLGGVSDETLRVLYATATIVCCPSLDEGFGLTPLEAMSAGAPTIISRAPALMETCGDAAITVDAESPQEIAAAISMLVSDESRRSALIAAGLLRARTFSWRDSADRLRRTAHDAVRARIAREAQSGRHRVTTDRGLSH